MLGGCYRGRLSGCGICGIVANREGAVVKPTEHEIQSAFIEWVRYNEKKYPELSTLFAIPNGELRKISVAKRLKKEGVKAGVLDICLPVSRSMFKNDPTCDSIYIEIIMYHSLYIEFKRPGGRLSRPQQEVGTNLVKYGNLVLVVWSTDAAIEAVTAYLSGEMPTFRKKYLERIV